jgi:hypothetical protein
MGRGMMKTWMKNSPTYNWVYINEATKVGSYTLLESQDKDYVMRYEMVSEKDGVYELKAGFDKAPKLAGHLKALEWHYLLTRDGFVKNAYLLDLANGSRTELQISGEGDTGYITPETTKLKKTEIVETKAGTFEVKEVAVYNMMVNLGYSKAKVTFVDFIDPKVPFGIVRKQETQSAKMPVNEVLKFISTVNPALAAPNTLMKFLIDKASDASYKRTWTLKEIGQRPAN